MQDNVKRLLAYSSIAHAGYLLVAFAALPNNGIPAAMFYTASYAAMNVGAFAVVSHFGGAGERYVTLEDYAGLGRRSPLLAATLTIFLLSLIGIPITGGFFAKFYVFSAALQANLVGLVIIGVLNSAVGAYYYLRIIVVMYMREAREKFRCRQFRSDSDRRWPSVWRQPSIWVCFPDECSTTPPALPLNFCTDFSASLMRYSPR